MLVRRSAAPSPRPPSRMALCFPRPGRQVARPSGGDFWGTENVNHHSLARARHLKFGLLDNATSRLAFVAHASGQAIVDRVKRDAPLRSFARFFGMQPLTAARESAFSRAAAFECVKHPVAFELRPEHVQKLVNIPLKPRAMEVLHA